MKAIIAGSRTILDYDFLVRVMSVFDGVVTEVFCGGARGVDMMGERWAKERGIPVRMFPAQWNKFGNAAGPIRNAEMAMEADMLVAIWDGKSRGTKNMIDDARLTNLAIFVYEPPDASGNLKVRGT